MFGFEYDDICRTMDAETYAVAKYLEQSVSDPAPTYTPDPVMPPTRDSLKGEPAGQMARLYLALTQPTTRRPRHLVISNEYPTMKKIYAGGFVHRRVKGYLDTGLEVDVMAFGRGHVPAVSEYEDVRVLHGYVHELQTLLLMRNYDSVSVHFLNSQVWNTLLPFLQDLNVIVYIHGYEARGWVRTAERPLGIAPYKSQVHRTRFLQSFWKSVVGDAAARLQFVFVSEWARSMVEDDMKVTFPSDRVTVIPNYIDAQTFTPRRKHPDLRYKVLWARTAHTRTYGNDLAIQAIQYILERDCDKLFHFEIFGGGTYFSEFRAAFEGVDQVCIEERFLTHEELAQAHSRNGIFLVPTRLDTQGVSRDEAIMSGLVSATNEVCAIPEFVDSRIALLAGAEDGPGLGRLIWELSEDPARFVRMSAEGHLHAESKSGWGNTVAREIQLMRAAETEAKQAHG